MRHLNYRGDNRGTVGQVVGPDLSGGDVAHHGRASYDEAADVTRCDLLPALPPAAGDQR